VHNVNANNALEVWHVSTYSSNHKAMNDKLRRFKGLALTFSEKLASEVYKVRL
jgi:inhibitor of KinA sporulation pathway (predicted exonuclease)